MFKSVLKYLGFGLLSIILFYILLILFFPIDVIKTVDDDLTLPSVTLNGHKFHAETFGDPQNQVVIALHGGPGGDYRYMLSLKALSKNYFVVLYDQRMTGLSSRKDSSKLTLQSYFEDLDHFIDHYENGNPVYIVGHSWGAMMASGYVGMHPEKVSKIVLIEPGILKADLADKFLNQSGPDLEFIDFVHFAKIWLNQWRVRTDKDIHAREDYVMSQIGLYFASKTYEKIDHLGWRSGFYSQDKTEGKAMREPAFLATLDFLKGVDKFEGDVLFLTSEENTVYGADYQKEFLKYYQHAHQEIVPNSGHSIFIDQPAVSNQMIGDFFSEKYKGN